MKKGYDSEELLDASPFLKKNDMIVPSPPPMYFGDDDDTHSVMTTMTMGFRGKNPDSLIRAIGSNKAKINPFLKVDANVGMGSRNGMKIPKIEKKELMQSEMKTNRSERLLIKADSDSETDEQLIQKQQTAKRRNDEKKEEERKQRQIEEAKLKQKQIEIDRQKQKEKELKMKQEIEKIKQQKLAQIQKQKEMTIKNEPLRIEKVT